MTDSHPHEGTAPSSHPTRHTVVVPNSINMVSLLGPGDEHLALLERSFGADVHVRGNRITLYGEPGEVALAERLLDELVAIIRTGQGVTTETVERVLAMLRAETTERPADVLSLNILSNRGRSIRPKTLNQKRYVDSIDKHTITFGIGPAGTGKTYLAMAKAVQALQSKSVTRIILTRPAVEAGERLGYLPGTLSEKIDPYLRPLYDALHDMIDPETIPKLLAAGTIEVAPLAYMRGRAQPYDAKVLTPTGWTTMGALEVGDLVVGSDGLPTPVLGIHPQGVKDAYRVTAQDGASTICCGEHLWTVTTPRDRRRNRTRTLETREMIDGLRCGHTRRYELPLVGAVEFEPRDVPLDPYALGLLLADGRHTPSTAPCSASADHLLGHADGARGAVRTVSPVTVALRELGPAGSRPSTAFVPEAYLHNSPEVRRRVLQGLLDGSGEPATREGRTRGVSWSTTSPRLRDDVVHLVRSLGGTATRRTPPRPADAYVVEIRLPEGPAPIRPRRFVERIEPVGRREMMCIQVAAEDSLYVTDDFLVTHNTLNDAFIILDEAQNTSPEQMKMFLTRLGFGSKIVVTGDVTQVDLPGGTKSGLKVIEAILDGVEDIVFNRLTSHDVVRHRLVGKIVAAYDEADARGEIAHTAHPRGGPR